MVMVNQLMAPTNLTIYSSGSKLPFQVQALFYFVNTATNIY